jgi:SnoaL-like domain
MNRREILKWVTLSGPITLLASAKASAQTTNDSPSNPSDAKRSQQMSTANERVVTYLAAWNERDAKRRRELVAKTWSDTGTYVDAHRHAEGLDAIDAMIAQAQGQFPGYQLRLRSGIEAHSGNVRFSWAAGGTEQAPLYLGGTDFALIAGDGRFQTVTGFVDAAPAH